MFAHRVKTAVLAAGQALASRPALLTFGFGALYLATFDSEMGSPDENHRYNLGVRIAREGLGALERSGGVSKYPPLQSLLAAPLMKVGLALDGGADGLWTHRLGLSISLLACLALIPLFWWVARQLEVPARRAALATALFGITNPLWPYSKRFFSEPLTAALAFGAFAGALSYARTGRRLPLALGLACLAILPLNNMIVPIAMGLALGALFLVERRRAAIGGLALAAAVGGALVAGSLWLRFGTLLDTGYNNERFWFKVLDGLHGLLFGWGRSIFLFATLTVLSLLGARALWRRSRGAAAAMGVALGAALLVVSSWWCWWGGICWGPRLVLPVLPVASIGAAALLAEPRRWKTALAVLVAVFGLYVQGLGFAFKHDFDIYFWMNGDYEQERKAWFEWEYSTLRRMPRHFREHHWDLSSSFLTLEQTGPSVVELGRQPVRRVEIAHRGDALVYNWSISDVFALVQDGEGTRRVPARELGARFEAYNRQRGDGALDGDPRTRWSTGTKRLDGMWIRLELERVRDDLVRLELEHLPHERDFPNALSARIQADGEWAPVPARAATPRLRWSPWLLVFAGVGLLLVLLALRREAAVAAVPDAAPSGN